MGQVIKFPRLFLLVKNHLVENKNRYLLYAVGMFFIGLITFVLLFISSSFEPEYYRIKKGEILNPDDLTDWEQLQIGVYYFGIFIFGGLFACTSFVNFSNSAEAIFYLNKPASQFEKWFTEIIVRVVFFFIAYTCLFYLLDIPFVMLARNSEYAIHQASVYIRTEEQLHLSRVMWITEAMDSDIKGEMYLVILSAYLSMVGFFMYGAVLYNRFSFFKTLILAFGVGIIYFVYGLLFADSNLLMPGEWDYRFPANAAIYEPGKIDLVTEYSDTFMFSLVYFLMFAVPTVLFFCSYLKLKEKEV